MKSNLLSVKKQTNSIYWLRKYCQFQSDGFSRPGFQLLIYKRTKFLFEIFRTTRGKSDIFYNVCYFKRGGFAHENFENIISRQRLTQNVHLVGQLFGRVQRPQTIKGVPGGHAHFTAKNGLKNQKLKISIITWISHHQSIDNSLMSSHHHFQPNCNLLVLSNKVGFIQKYSYLAKLWPTNCAHAHIQAYIFLAIDNSLMNSHHHFQPNCNLLVQLQ